jgi:cyclase
MKNRRLPSFAQAFHQSLGELAGGFIRSKQAAKGDVLMFRFVIGVGVVAAVSAAGTMVLAQAAPQAQGAAPAPGAFSPAVVRQVKPGLFMVVGNGGNSVVRVAGDGVILVDTKLPGEAFYQDLVQKIQSVSDKPIKFVFITHVHNDHSGNTARFEAAGAKVIASDAYKALVQTYTVNPGQTRSPQPDIAFAKTYSVKLKDASAQAYAFYPGHTGGDSIVYFPDEKVVAMGDDLVAGAPSADWANGGSLTGLQKTWTEVDKLDFDTLIPGHGDAPISRADFEAARKKLDLLVERLRTAVQAGVPKTELLAKIQVDDLGWNIRESRQWNTPPRIDGLYAEMSGK